jgi:hypothetical protein
MLGSPVCQRMSRLRRTPAGETVNALAFVAWLNRDGIIHRLETEIDSGHNDATALDDDERSRRLAIGRIT